MSDRLDFGIFLAPFHVQGEHPTVALQRDLELVARLDALGYDEAWAGEHHSGGWELISSPEMFLAAAGERTSRIRLGTGVVSLPYHHPFHVADRIVFLDHLTRGRAMLGVGPGALPGDARMLGIASTTQRPRMDEALGVILRLLMEEEPVTYRGDWFELHEAQLQLKPLQRPVMPVAVATTISPAGMVSAGKHGAGALSLSSYSEEGLNAIRTQWAFAEKSAAEARRPPPDRATWRIVSPFHLAESREQALSDIADGILRWHNDYFINTFGVPGRQPASDGREFAEQMMAYGGGVFGTPDDAIAHIQRLRELSGGFGCFLGLAHEWTTREKTLHSYELMARYVMPVFQDAVSSTKRSNDWTVANRESLMSGTQQAIVEAMQRHGAVPPGGADGAAEDD